MIKNKLLPVLLALITAAAVMTACAGGKSSRTGNEANNRVYPEGEGHFFETTVAELTTTPSTTVAGSSASTQPTTKNVKATTATTKATAAAAVPTAVNPAVTSPKATISTNVPADNVTGDNINPGIGAIQSRMSSQIEALAVQSIALSETSLTLEPGESKTVTITFNPTDAAIKTCKVTADNGNVTATATTSTLTVTGVKAGTATVTVTSHNGHTATCDVTVKRSEQTEAGDDTVLPHKDLVTVTNAERWTADVAARLEALGMRRNTSLQGEGVHLTTDGLNDQSYNSALSLLLEQAETELASQTGGDWSGYEFNCVLRTLENGEYGIIIVINQTP